MDVDSVCLKSASVVVDRDLVHDPARALEADPGLVLVPEAAPGLGAVLVPAPNLVPNPEADPALDPNLEADLNQLIAMGIQKRTEIATDPSRDQDPVLEQNQNLVLGPDLEMTKNNGFPKIPEKRTKNVYHIMKNYSLHFFLFFFPCCCIVPAFSHRKR
jgi:hypothetical protein